MLVDGQIFVTPAKKIEITTGELDTKEYIKTHPDFTEKEIDDRIKKDQQFDTEEIKEITADEEEVLAIKKQKDKEAQELIKEVKKRKKK